MRSVAENNWRRWWPSQADAIAAATSDREAVLKLSPRVAGETDVLAHEGSALARWAPAGIAPTVLAARDDGLTLLLGRVRPGHDLRHADAGEIVRTLGALCPQVHLAVKAGEFRPIGEGSQADSGGPPAGGVMRITVAYGA